MIWLLLFVVRCVSFVVVWRCVLCAVRCVLFVVCGLSVSCVLCVVDCWRCVVLVGVLCCFLCDVCCALLRVGVRCVLSVAYCVFVLLCVVGRCVLFVVVPVLYDDVACC